jgi:hypothetical protein
MMEFGLALLINPVPRMSEKERKGVEIEMGGSG